MIIATYNLEFLFGEGRHVHSGDKWDYSAKHVEDRINYFSKAFKDINADVLFLQEVASENVVQRIIDKSGLGYSYFMAVADQNGVGNAVLYKDKDTICASIPAKSSLPIFITGDEDIIGKRIWSRRDLIHLQTTFKNNKLHLFGIHIKSNFLMPEKTKNGEAKPINTQIDAADGLIRSEIFRFSQAKKLREKLGALFASDPNANIAVCGDYNSEENDSVYRIIQGVNRDKTDSLIATNHKLPEAKRYSHAEGSNGKKKLIDHILISKSVEPHLSEVKILNELITKNTNVAPNPTMVGSDHAPFIIELI